MSRRRRRGNGGAKTGWAVKIPILLLVALIAAAAISFGLIRSYLHGEAFRMLLSERVSTALDVNGAFAPMRWDGFSTRTPFFEGAGEGRLLSIRADDITTEVGLEQFRSGYWLLKGSAVRQLDLVLDLRNTDAGEELLVSVTEESMDLAAQREEQTGRSWLPAEVRYDVAKLDHVSARVFTEAGEVLLKDHHVQATHIPGPEANDFYLRGGKVVLPLDWLPELRLNDMHARHQGDSVFLTSSHFSIFGRGRLDVAGEYNHATGDYAFQGAASGVECADLLNEDWSRRLTGRMWVDFSVKNDSRVGAVVDGQVEIREGVLTALPLLDSLSAYADTQRFRTLTLHEARADWTWSEGRWLVKNIRLTSEGLVRISGTLSIDEDERIDGTFQIGLAPGTLARIPGAETMVFQPGEHGLMWTRLRVTGTLDKPREDLSERLLAAAGLRMLETLPETGEHVLKYTQTLLGELPQDAVDRVADLLEGLQERKEVGKDILKEAGGLLEGVLRGGRKKD